MKKLKLRIVALLMAASLLLGASTATLAAGWENGEVSRAGVIRVCQIDAYGTLYGFGTGFFVGEAGQPVEYIITNAHVAGEVSNYDGENSYYSKTYDQVTIVFDTLESSSTQSADVVEVFRDIDVAILKLDTPTTQRQALTLMSAAEVDISEPVYAIGFPDVGDEDSAVDPALREFKSAPGDTTVNSGTISNQQKVLEGENYLQIDATINAGNSGGPLCTEEGYVVGINSMTATYGNDTNYALYVDYAMDWLDQNGVAYQKSSRADAVLAAANADNNDVADSGATDSPIGSSARNPIYLYAAIACAAVALAAAVWIIVLKQKTNRGGIFRDDPVLPADGWVCVSCGIKNDGMFCEHCGLPKPGVAGGEMHGETPPSPETWVCTNCGSEISTLRDRCDRCGTPRYAVPSRSEWTCSCGQVNTGRDCTGCGAERGSEGKGSRLGRGGTVKPETKLVHADSSGSGELRVKVHIAGDRPAASSAPAELKTKVKLENKTEPSHEPDPLFKRLDSDDF